METVSNQAIRKMSYKVNFIGATVLMCFVLLATYRYMSEQVTLLEALEILFSCLIVFIVFRAGGWLVRGFEQRVIPVHDAHKDGDTHHKTEHSIHGN